MAAGDSISDAEEENEDESKRTTTPRALRGNSFIDSICLSPPPSNSWSLVSIKDNHEGEDESSFLIFPPTHHENLHLSPPSPPPHPPALDFKHHGKSLTLPFLSSSSSSSEIVDEDESNDDSSTSTLFSPSTGPDSPPVPRARKMVGVVSWVNLGMEVLYSKVKGVLLYGSQSIPVKKSAFTAAAMVVGFLYFWWRRRRGMMEHERRDLVARIIKEKDERINQLLNQIARMNDLLLALQRLPAPSKDLK